MAWIAIGTRAAGKHEAVQLEISQVITALPWVCCEIGTGQRSNLVRLIYGFRTEQYRELTTRFHAGLEKPWTLYSVWRSFPGSKGKTIENLKLGEMQFQSFQELIDYVESKLLDPLEVLALKAKMNPRQNPKIDTSGVGGSVFGGGDLPPLIRAELRAIHTALPWKFSNFFQADHISNDMIILTHETSTLRLERRNYPNARTVEWRVSVARPVGVSGWLATLQEAVDFAESQLLDPLEYLANKAKDNPPQDEQRAAKKRIQFFCSVEAKHSGYKSARIVKSLGKDKNGSICFLVRLTRAEPFWDTASLDESSGLYVAYAIFPACRVPGGWGFHPIQRVSELELIGLLGSKMNPKKSKVYSPRMLLTDNSTRMTSSTALPWKLVHDEPNLTIWAWKKSIIESWEIRAWKEWDGRKYLFSIYALKYVVPPMDFGDVAEELIWDGKSVAMTSLHAPSDAAFTSAIRKIELEIAGGGELALLALATKSGKRR